MAQVRAGGHCKLASLPKAASYILFLAAAPVLCLVSWWSFRAARADLLERDGTLAGAQRAVLIMPGSARAHDNAAAAYATADPMTRSEDAELRTAVNLNPRDSNAWMMLGLKYEMEGRTAEAERSLMRAVEANRMFKPAWSAANFYFRTGQTDKFWPWAKRSLEVSEPKNGETMTINPWPVFDLCWNTANDAATIERLAIPESAPVLGLYVSFLAATNRLDAGVDAAQRLYPIAVPGNLAELYSLCDALIQGGRGKEALRIWNGMSGRHLIPYPKLAPKAGLSLVNGNLTASPSGKGFDWHLEHPPDVYERYSAASRTLRFELNGDQPENCELFEEPVVLEPGYRYRLLFRYRTAGMAGATGMRWSVTDAATHRELASVAPLMSQDDEGSGSAAFETLADTSLARLAFRYDRQPGTTRPKGLVEIRSISLELTH